MSDTYFIRPERARLSARELWQSRALFWNLVRAAAVQPYRGMRAGYLWTLGRPFLFLVVLAFIKSRSNGDMGERDLPYPLFLYTGLVLWWYFVDALKQAARSPQTYRGLITKIYFPRIIIPAIPVFSRLVDLGIQAVGLVLMMLVYGRYPGTGIWLLPVVLVNVVLLCLGFGYLFAVASVVSRDAERILDYLLYVGLFLSPVLYTLALIPPEYRTVYTLLNPMAGPMSAIRSALFSGVPVDAGALAASLVTSAVLCVLGGIVYQKVQGTFAERM